MEQFSIQTGWQTPLAFQPKTIWECSTESFLLKNEWEADMETKTISISSLKQNFFTVSQVAHETANRSGKWKTYGWYPLEESKKFKFISSNCYFLGNPAAHPVPSYAVVSLHPPSPVTENRIIVNGARHCATLRFKETSTIIFALRELPI